MSHAALIVAPTLEQVTKLGIEEAIEWEMKPFDEGEEWFADGSRWDWYAIGGRFDGMLAGENIVQIKNLSVEECEKTRVAWLTETYKDYLGRPNHPLSDVEKDETLEQYIARRRAGCGPIHAYAFLRNRHWNEAERMGWFGGTAYTECERKDLEKPVSDPDKWFGKCLHKNEEMGAQIVCWNEPEEIWQANYYQRFIENLHPDNTIAVVDYHV